jgi:hypothetical protein
LSIAVIATLIGCDLFRDLLKLNKDEIPTELPAETQTGANTFGCYINDSILFVHDWTGAPFMHRTISAELQSKNDNALVITAYSRAGYICMKINKPKLDSSSTMSVAYFMPKSKISWDCFYLGGKDIGEITITKLDTVECVVSGTFQFVGRCYDDLFEIPGDSTVNVSNGRFDIKLEIY